MLLDTRAREEFEVSHLAGAVHVAPAGGAEAAAQALDSAAEAAGWTAEQRQAARCVCYCSVGYRSSQMADDLRRSAARPDWLAAERVANLEGSIFQWANEGRSVVSTATDGTEQPAAKVHPYNWMWGKMLNADLRADI